MMTIPPHILRDLKEAESPDKARVKRLNTDLKNTAIRKIEKIRANSNTA